MHEKLSDVLAQFPVDYLCYGDGAYPVLRYIKRGVKLARDPGPDDAINEANGRKMSKVRECVEWGFGKIFNLWAFLDFKKNLQMHSAPLGVYYTVMANLTNCHTCFYGGQTASYFECVPPTIEEYLA